MTAPSIFNPLPDPIRNKANWLGRYLDVEKKYDKKLRAALSDAATNIDEVFGNLVRENVSTKVERVRIALAHKEIRRQMSELFGTTGYLIRDHRQDAAVAAVNAKLFDERGVLSWLFPDSVNRLQYADNLRQSARRNIESVVTRILFTEKPLSERVYKTEALANGLVSKTINNALARGDSARNLAKDVRALIDPEVPGGVSYAAMRLGRTELNNAFHAQSIFDTQETPWVEQMRWHLSKRHEKDPGDECETYAAQATFRKEDVPEKPHPNCRCFVTPELPDYDQFEQSLLAGHYNSYLDSVMGEGFSDQGGAFAAPSPRAQKLLEQRRAEKAAKPQPVKWTGPKVAKPLDARKDIPYGYMPDEGGFTAKQTEARIIWQDLEDHWVSGRFDEYKQDFRIGARVAQRDGYTGFPKALLDTIDQGTYGDPSVLRAYGKEIVADAIHSDPTTIPLYRGLRVEASDLSLFEPGKHVSLPLSSFDKDEGWAIAFAKGEGTWQSQNALALKNPASIIFELEPGAKVSTLPYGERIAFGQFDIVKIIPAHQGEIEVLSRMQPAEIPMKVVLRQKSLIEKAVEQGLSGGKMAADPEIPEFEIIEKAVARSTAAQAKRNAALAKELKKIFPNAKVDIADGVDPELVKETVMAYKPLAKKMPEIASNITNITYGATPDASFGYTEPVMEYPKAFRAANGRKSKISFNGGIFSSKKNLQEKMDEVVASGMHHAGVEINPGATVPVHEFGHSINYALGYDTGKGASPGDFRQFIFEWYDSHMPPEKRNGDDWQAWILEQVQAMPKYVRAPGKRHVLPMGFEDLDINEVLAESFETVELRGSTIDLENIAHDFLWSKYKELIRGKGLT